MDLAFEALTFWGLHKVTDIFIRNIFRFNLRKTDMQKICHVMRVSTLWEVNINIPLI